jgi:type III secretion system PrgH/EprH family protein
MSQPGKAMTKHDRKNDVTRSSYVFRVLSGSLNGIEFSLGAQDHFICVNEDTARQANLAIAERSLFIPASKPGNNFILNLGDQSDDQEFQLTICHAEHQETQRLSYNVVHQFSGVAFAIRSENDLWTEEVLSGLQLQAATQTSVLELDSISTQPPAIRKSKRVASLVAGAVLLVMASATYIGWNAMHGNALANVFHHDESDAINQLVVNHPGFSVHPGTDKINYLFASTDQQVDLANQIINQKALTHLWRVVTPQTEEQRLEPFLDRSNVAFFTIRYADPSNPILLMSSTRNEITKANLDSIVQMMLAAMPYAKTVHIQLEEDSEVANKAKQGLRALGFKFDEEQSESGLTLSSWMPSVDVHLTEFSNFVHEFYQTWGRRYVHFSADIREDQLKDKSFKYGDEGYITMSKSHWLFNSKVE